MGLKSWTGHHHFAANSITICHESTFTVAIPNSFNYFNSFNYIATFTDNGVGGIERCKASSRFRTISPIELHNARFAKCTSAPC
jgi:hypothetical protein